MNFYKRYIGDYARDTGHLSMLEHGAYTLLLDAFYGTKRALPGNKLTLYRLVRATTKRERDAVDSVLAEFWSLEGGKWLNRRALREIEKASAQAETNRKIATERETNRATNRITKPVETVPRTVEPNHSHSHSQIPDTRARTNSCAAPSPKPEDRRADTGHFQSAIFSHRIQANRISDRLSGGRACPWNCASHPPVVF